MPSPATDTADATLRAIGEALAPIDPIQVAYLFGSRARGTARPDSDLDVAIALPRDLNDALRQLTSRESMITAEALAHDAALQAAVERWLQIAIEACIDSAYHVIADRGLLPPDSARQAFESLASEGLLPKELAARLGRAAGLRNILVHDYTRVDRALLAAIVHNDLGYLRAFGAAVGALLKPPP